MAVTNDERRRVAAALRRKAGKNLVTGVDIEEAIWGDACSGFNIDEAAETYSRLADLIEPDPRAEELVAKAYRAAADQIDWELGDTPRVMALRARARELEEMARGRDVDVEAHEPTPKCSEATPKCDREALLALAREMDDVTCDKRGEMTISLGDVWGWSGIILEALGVE